jgi:hypothetical protein
MRDLALKKIPLWKVCYRNAALEVPLWKFRFETARRKYCFRIIVATSVALEVPL